MDIECTSVVAGDVCRSWVVNVTAVEVREDGNTEEEGVDEVK